jgi:hypothetical protein
MVKYIQNKKLYPLRNGLPGAHGVIPEKVTSKRA